jgi:hypothetical protein
VIEDIAGWFRATATGREGCLKRSKRTEQSGWGISGEDGTVSKMISSCGVPSPEILNKRFEDMPGRPFHFGLIFYDRFCGERFRNCLPPVLDRCGGVAFYLG